MATRPGPHGPRYGHPARHRSVVPGRRGLRRVLRLVGQRPVGPEDERAEQRVTAREVAVQRRGGHLQVAGDGAQGEGRSALTGQMGPGHGEDLAGDLVLDPIPSGAWRRHAISVAVPEREHKYLT